MAEKISVKTLAILLIFVAVLSALLSTYTMVSLGLVKYPRGADSKTSGIVTVNVIVPPQEVATTGKVTVTVLPAENESGAAKSVSPGQ